MKLRRKTVTGLAIGGVLLLVYGGVYLGVREKDLDLRPFYVAIRYGKERIAVRCVNTDFVADAPGIVTLRFTADDMWYDPRREYTVAVAGAYVTMNRRDSRNVLCIFRPLEWLELTMTRVH